MTTDGLRPRRSATTPVGTSAEEVGDLQRRADQGEGQRADADPVDQRQGQGGDAEVDPGAEPGPVDDPRPAGVGHSPGSAGGHGTAIGPRDVRRRRAGGVPRAQAAQDGRAEERPRSAVRVTMIPSTGAPRPWDRSKNMVKVPMAWLRSDSGAASTTAGNSAG